MKSSKTKLALLVCGLVLASQLFAMDPPSKAVKPGMPISLSFRDAPIQEVFEMLSRQERVNILLAKGVSGTVTMNLYDTTLPQAIRAIADAAGYTVEERNGSYVVVERKEAGLDSATGNTQIRSFKVQYSDPKQVAEILTKQLSRYGKITPLSERRLIIVEDLPEFIGRIQAVLKEIDVQPRQILIEAKILEITLNADESFGIDWTKIFSANGVNRVGVNGLAKGNAVNLPTGLFFNLINQNVEVFLSALSDKGRVHTLSTPKLLALENQEASAKIGDNLGYRVTTTINNVTTESIQFLETGVILKVTPSVDEEGRILLKIHPEVSSGSLSGGIPSKYTTEVTTQMLAFDGQAILIGGLIQNTTSFRRTGVPVLGELPIVGRVFSSTEQKGTNTETIVIITSRVLKNEEPAAPIAAEEKIGATEGILLKQTSTIESALNWPK
jgi:type II secretory pathway component GspD/PulD (secretin)